MAKHKGRQRNENLCPLPYFNMQTLAKSQANKQLTCAHRRWSQTRADV